MNKDPKRRPLHLAAMLILPALTLAMGCVSQQNTADFVYFPPPPAAPHAVHLKSFNKLHDLIRPSPSLADLLRGGAISPSVGRPAGIAYSNGHLYICDTDINAVHDWDLATGAARRIGLRGDVVLVKPVAVAVDGSGTLYVADMGRAEVIAFDAGGNVRLRIKPADREAFKPTAVAVDGKTLYVTDIAAHVVDVFSTEDGQPVDTFGGVGSEPGQFYFPMGLCTDMGGRLWLSDMMNARVQVFNADHQPVLSMGQPGDRYGDMGKPRHLAVGSDGVAFIADAEFARVHLFNAQGQCLMMIGGSEDRPGGTPMPVSVTVATEVPDHIAALVPADFKVNYYLFVTNTIGAHRINLFAIGSAQNTDNVG